jgi:hypothetical protein
MKNCPKFGKIRYLFFSSYVFCEPHSFLIIFSCRPSQRSARSQVPSQVATHQKIGSQLWAWETPDSNPGLQDNSQAHYHWATTPPILSHHASQEEYTSVFFIFFFICCNDLQTPSLLCCKLQAFSLQYSRFLSLLFRIVQFCRIGPLPLKQPWGPPLLASSR